MESLLNKTRKLNKTLQAYGSKPVSFLELSKILSNILEANVYIASKKGKILGHERSSKFDCNLVETDREGILRFPEKYNDDLLFTMETKSNVKELPEDLIDNSSDYKCDDIIITIIPINSGGERLGTLVLARVGENFTVEDLILAEYSATIVGMEILRSKSEKIEAEARKKSIVQMAIDTLSYSELEAMEYILAELDGSEGLLVASKIADRVGITRSVIVNALRKFESAGVIESRSLGMKGTHIKILNDKLMEELNKR